MIRYNKEDMGNPREHHDMADHIFFKQKNFYLEVYVYSKHALSKSAISLSVSSKSFNLTPHA